jgi:hypothetical protein
MLVILYEELMTILVARVTETLNRLIDQQLPLVPETAVLHLILPTVFCEIPVRKPWRTGLQHQDLHPRFGEFFGYPPAARS